MIFDANGYLASERTFKRWDAPQEPFDWDVFRRLMLAQLKRGPVYRQAPISASKHRALVRRHKRELLAECLGWRRPP